MCDFLKLLQTSEKIGACFSPFQQVSLKAKEEALESVARAG